MLNVAPQKERIPDHLRAMAEQDDKSAASGKTGEQSSIGVGCAPGEERDSAISICAVHSTTVTAAIAEFCEDTVEKQKTLTEVLDGLVDLTTRLASLATALPCYWTAKCSPVWRTAMRFCTRWEYWRMAIAGGFNRRGSRIQQTA